MKNLKVKVCIKSCHAHPERRQAQRETWLPELDVDFFFLIGGAPTDEKDVLYCQAPDTFSSIAPKVWCACKYALEENVTNLFVCDDDTYCRPDRLLGPDAYYWKGDYIGFVRTNGVPYIQGSAYWLSERSMEQVVLHKEIMRPDVIDDGAVGQCLVDRVQFVHDWRYQPGPNGLETAPLPQNNFITTHKCLPAQMKVAHKPWAITQKG